MTAQKESVVTPERFAQAITYAQWMAQILRDQNLDIANEFLYKGEFQSIPTLVFYTKDLKYLAHWIERAQKARDEMHLLSATTSKMRDPELSPEEREKYMAEYAAFQRGPIW